MKNMIYTIFAAAMALPLASCSDDSPVLTQKDWEGTSTYFSSTDEKYFATYYQPSVGYIGDPMPFFDPVSKEFKILYLQEFRPNQATYHPVWGLSTKDLSSYTPLGELISTGSEVEPDAAIGTGSTIYNDADKLYYTFYTGHTASNEVIMLATSPDFKTWTKNKTLYINGGDYGYDVKNFRDPFVFKGDDGLFHMIISTYNNGKGSLVEFQSSDLLNWQHNGVFMTMMWDRFYECPDIFRMGDWWYLVYSEQRAFVRKVQYFKGRTLDELKSATANDAGIWPDNHEGFLDSRAFYAGKTASDGTNRYIWGWCPTRAGNDNTAVSGDAEPEWAGALVAHKLIQHEDGSLTLGVVDGISNKYNQISNLKVMAQSEEGVQENDGVYTLSGNTYTLFNRLNVHNKITFKLTVSGDNDKFGFSFCRGTDSEKYYSMIINPEGTGRKKLNFEEEGSVGKGFISGADSYIFDAPTDKTYNVTILTDNSVCVVYINDILAYTNRIYNLQKNCWSINCYSGNINVSDINVMYY